MTTTWKIYKYCEKYPNQKNNIYPVKRPLMNRTQTPLARTTGNSISTAPKE
jgi:hypothetical protein